MLVVDPGDAKPVMRYLQQAQLKLGAILITHQHADHVGGIAELKQAYPDLVVYAPEKEPIPHADIKLKEGDRIVAVPGMDFSPQVLDVPGHTEGHIAYLQDDLLFCGDTLFACGCGRVFSGTTQQLHHSLQKLAQLPKTTKVYCAHEYTLDNIGFAKWVEPDNTDLLAREQQVINTRKQGKPSVPSLLGDELKTNPFLRSEVDTVVRAAERYAGQSLSSGSAVFATVRQWKDQEYD